MATEAEAALAAAYATAGKRGRAQILNALVTLWRGLDGYRDADADRFAPLAASYVLAGQRQTANLVAAYMAQQRSLTLGVPNRPVRIALQRVTGAAVRNGADPVQVYRRPFAELWRLLGNQVPFTPALQQAEQRLVKTVESDLELAKTHSSQVVVEQDRDAVGYRRVLVGEENCGMCVIASTRIYDKHELMPIHPGCDCGVDAVYDAEKFDGDAKLQLASTHAAVANTFGQSAADGRRIDYRKLILTEQHGELGPVLVVAKHHFRSETDLRRKA